MRGLLTLVVLGFATALHASAQPGSIEDFITAEMPVSGAPGIAYAVVEDGEISSGARGEILSGSGRVVTPDTPFVIGSISKSFTALAVMQLVEAGKIDLDAGISQYLDVFSGRAAAAVTIRQLLSHTSGYSTLQGNDTHTDQALGNDELMLQVKRIAQWTPAYAPGAKWDYSNANYYVLGALIESVSGQDYASYIETQILEPIGMAHSFVADGDSYDNIAIGHRPWFGAKRPVEGGTTDRLSAPVGGVIASASDVARYLAIMMNGEDDIVSAESKAEMMHPASAVSPFYGFGWGVDTGNETVSHTGLTPGIETLAMMVPAERKGVVVLINSGSGMGFGENANLFNGVSARALGLDYAADQSQWGRKGLFAMFVLLPFLFVAGMIVAGLRGEGLRAKSGFSGAFSLWFPFLTTLALAWIAVYLIPQLFGVSIGTLWVFSPDLALTLIATAVSGVIWAVFRLGVFYSRR
jgi:CubicO group peptidase (beta-lactamase class C family)